VVPTTAQGHPNHTGAAARSRRRGGIPLLFIVLVVVVLLILIAAALWWRRLKGHDGRTDHGPPEQRIVAAWNQAQRGLARRGLGRRPTESPGEYAARLDRLEGAAPAGIGAQAMRHLAALVEAACYGPRPCTAVEAEAALGLSATVLAAQRRH
jgi:hypothetical protein